MSLCVQASGSITCTSLHALQQGEVWQQMHLLRIVAAALPFAPILRCKFAITGVQSTIC